MKKASIIMAVLACAIIAAAYTNSVPISTSTRAATEKWTAIRFEPALPPTPANAASKFLDGNREWQTVTAAQIGALTNELDLAALRTYHYSSPDIVESPAEWFAFDGAGTITAFNWAAGRENVVIPWAIGGVPVTAIGANAFSSRGIVSLIAPQTVTSIGDSAFITCHSLVSVNLPQVTSIGDYAFYDCASLTSVHMGQNAPAEAADVFADIATPPTVYVTDPQATGWGATWNGVNVVRLPLYADAIYQAGELVATTGYVAQASLADADGYTTQMVMRVGSEIATNRWGPRLTLPDGIVTNGTIGATVGSVTMTNGYFLSGVNAPVATFGFGGLQDNRFILRTPNGVNGGILIAGGSAFVQFCDRNFAATADFGIYGSDIYFVNRKIGKLRFGHVGKEDELMVTESGDVTVKNSFTVAGTNTAAEVRSLGGYSIFDSGSNCYWRVTASNGTFYASDTNGVRKFKFTTETPYTAWTGTVTPANGTATVAIAHGNMPVLVTTAPCVLTLDSTGYGTAGVSRVSLSYYPGTNSFTFATNVISYAETPTVDTNGWNTLLIRRVSNGAWKGVGL